MFLVRKNEMTMITIKAFTLLEMLLVLAVISVVSLAGLAAYQQRVQSFKAEKTALQMQEIMEAAQAFYIDHPTQTPTRWPQQESDFSSYLSGNVLHNCPWTYSASSTCYLISSTLTAFSVSVIIPSPQQVNAAQIAQMIANRLPNASVSGTEVKATIPKLSVTSSGFSIVSISSVSNGQSLILHPERCDPNTNHNVYFMLSSFAACGYEGNTQCYDTSKNGITAPPVNALGFGNIPVVTPNNNPAFQLSSMITNPPGTSLIVAMGGQWGMGTKAYPAYSYGGYHMSGVAIETCEPITSPQLPNENEKTPVQFY